MNMLDLSKFQYKVKSQGEHNGLHSSIASGADLDILELVSQIQES
jgi:hypothetical protein